MCSAGATVLLAAKLCSRGSLRLARRVIFGFRAMKALIIKKLRAPSATLQDVTRCASLVLLCQLLWQKSASCFTPVSLWGLDERFSRALPRFATYYYYYYYYYWRSSFSK